MHVNVFISETSMKNVVMCVSYNVAVFVAENVNEIVLKALVLVFIELLIYFDVNVDSYFSKGV